MVELEKLLIRPEHSIREAMVHIDRSGQGIVLLVDPAGRLEATITDGDIRRAILAGVNLDTSIAELIVHRNETLGRKPVTAPQETTSEELLELMQSKGVSQLPLLDKHGRVVGLSTLAELVPEQALPVQAVIMAGGFGKRLRPLTDDTPKPMLPIAGRPLMERTIERLRRAGIQRINITTHYKPEIIKAHFGGGEDFGVELTYVAEDQPLGTAGSLGLVGQTEQPLLVMNGDILTSVDFHAMLSFHQKHKAEMTVGVRQFDVEVPYGVVEAREGLVCRLREKPKHNFLVNAGIYLLEPSLCRCIPDGQRYDMTDLIAKLLDEKRPVASFPIVEYWLDIGRHDDLQQAQKDAGKMRWAS